MSNYGSLKYEAKTLGLFSNIETGGNELLEIDSPPTSDDKKWQRSRFKHDDSIWYKAKYQLAIMYIYQYLHSCQYLPNNTSTEDKINYLDLAVEQLLVIMLAYNDTIKSIKKDTTIQDLTYIGDLPELLEYIYILNWVLMASLFVHYTNHETDIRQKILDKIKDIGWTVKNNPDIKPNESILCEIIDNELHINIDELKNKYDPIETYDPVENYLRKKLNEFMTLNITKRANNTLSTNQPEKPEKQPDISKDEYILLPSGVHYGLACHYSNKYRLILNLKKGQTNYENIANDIKHKINEHLEFALEHDKNLISWFKFDPSLQVFREKIFTEYMKIRLKYFKPNC